MKNDIGITKKRASNNNSGFTLVELLVSVAVLTVIFFPILRMFVVANRLNSNAQKKQNSIALAQDIMEDVKSKTIEELVNSKIGTGEYIVETKTYIGDDGEGKRCYSPDTDTAKGNLGDVETIILKTKDNEYVTNTQGEKFKVNVEINARPKDEAGNDRYKDLNEAKLPVLPETGIVVSNTVNKWDEYAINTLYKVCVAKGVVTDISEIYYDVVKKTTINIIKDDNKYECYVTYNLTNATDTDKYKEVDEVKYLVQNGKYKVGKEPKIEIWLFYKFMADQLEKNSIGSEEIKVVGDDISENDYNFKLVLYNKDVNETTTDIKYVKCSDIQTLIKGSFTVLDDAIVSDTFGKNFSSNISKEEGGETKPIGDSVYESSVKNRIYDVTVKVYNVTNEERATVTSAMEAKY